MQGMFGHAVCSERVHVTATVSHQRRRHSKSSRVTRLVAALLPVTACFLQGCGTRRACKINDIYELIQVDGRTGLTKKELERAGVKLCARHLRKEETYSGDACTEPDKVFSGGDLPTPANGDPSALLLVRCPSTSYPKGKELQRVTCSDDYIGDIDDSGYMMKALHLRFDNYERASNCLLGITSADVNATMPKQVLAQVRRNEEGTRLMRSGDHISVVGRGVRHPQRGELQAAVAAVAATSGEARTEALVRELGPAVLAKADALLATADISIHPHGTFHVQRRHESHQKHGAKHHHLAHHAPHPEVRSASLFRAESGALDST